MSKHFEALDTLRAVAEQQRGTSAELGAAIRITETLIDVLSDMPLTREQMTSALTTVVALHICQYPAAERPLQAARVQVMVGLLGDVVKAQSSG